MPVYEEAVEAIKAGNEAGLVKALTATESVETLRVRFIDKPDRTFDDDPDHAQIEQEYYESVDRPVLNDQQIVQLFLLALSTDSTLANDGSLLKRKVGSLSDKGALNKAFWNDLLSKTQPFTRSESEFIMGRLKNYFSTRHVSSSEDFLRRFNDFERYILPKLPQLTEPHKTNLSRDYENAKITADRIKNPDPISTALINIRAKLQKYLDDRKGAKDDAKITLVRNLKYTLESVKTSYQMGEINSIDAINRINESITDALAANKAAEESQSVAKVAAFFRPSHKDYSTHGRVGALLTEAQQKMETFNQQAQAPTHEPAAALDHDTTDLAVREFPKP